MGTQQEFDFSVNLLQSLLWQYNRATALQTLVQRKQAWYDTNQTQFWTDWFNNVFNLLTANQFGLTVWAKILQVPIVVVQQPSVGGPPGLFFSANHSNFTHGNFKIVNPAAQQLTVEQARLCLRLRCYQIFQQPTIGNINQMLSDVFGPRNAYVLDGHDMTMTYIFKKALPSAISYIFENYDILPRPSGVKLNITIFTRTPIGFGSFYRNFNQGNFEV